MPRKLVKHPIEQSPPRTTQEVLESIRNDEAFIKSKAAYLKKKALLKVDSYLKQANVQLSKSILPPE